MKKIHSHILSVTTLAAIYLSSPLKAFADYCEINGEEVPCDVFMEKVGWIFPPIIILSIVLSVFWLWMLIDCLKRKMENKTTWIIVLIFTGFLGAILYFFLVKRKQS